MCRELEVNGSTVPVFHTDDFIFKVTVAKVTEKLPENREKLTEKLPEKPNRLTENKERLIEKLIEKASINGDKLTENKIAILTFMIEDPYISKSDLSKFVGISTAAISNNIEAMPGKYLRRVGPDKGGFWEIIK
jgi:ATP-dependent DNA helicase RecG